MQRASRAWHNSPLFFAGSASGLRLGPPKKQDPVEYALRNTKLVKGARQAPPISLPAVVVSGWANPLRDAITEKRR
jgi:hypothetical protein